MDIRKRDYIIGFLNLPISIIVGLIFYYSGIQIEDAIQRSGVVIIGIAVLIELNILHGQKIKSKPIEEVSFLEVGLAASKNRKLEFYNIINTFWILIGTLISGFGDLIYTTLQEKEIINPIKYQPSLELGTLISITAICISIISLIISYLLWHKERLDKAISESTTTIQQYRSELQKDNNSISKYQRELPKLKSKLLIQTTLHQVIYGEFEEMEKIRKFADEIDETISINQTIKPAIVRLEKYISDYVKKPKTLEELHSFKNHFTEKHYKIRKLITKLESDLSTIEDQIELTQRKSDVSKLKSRFPISPNGQ